MQSNSKKKNIFQSLKSVGREFADICVVVEGKTYNCHKIILGSVSEFFHRLLVTDCKETSSGIIKLEDVQSSIFDIIYEFIYSGGDEALLKKASIPSLLELLVCADKWIMPCLTDSCIDVIKGYDNWTMDELIEGFDTSFTLQNSYLTTTVINNLRARRIPNDCEMVYQIKASSFKEFLKFSQSLFMTELERFKLLEKWIKNQEFYSPDMQYSLPDKSQETPTHKDTDDTPDVPELLAMINYYDMSIEDFQSGPGNSCLISYQSKYTVLSALIRIMKLRSRDDDPFINFLAHITRKDN